MSIFERHAEVGALLATLGDAVLTRAGVQDRNAAAHAASTLRVQSSDPDA
jgi:hypothetical protein